MIPTVYRPASTGRLVVWMPFDRRNRSWLHEQLGDYIRPDWNKRTGHWEIARPHMRAVVEALVNKFGTVKVTIDTRAVSKCDTRCRDAEGDDCDCQCLGENHGGADYWQSWFEVGDTTLLASGLVRRVFHATRQA